MVNMSRLLGRDKGISRAYFSDYLIKGGDDGLDGKGGDDGKNYIYARFDFNVTRTPINEKTWGEFEISSIIATKTTTMLDCHKAALLHRLSSPNDDDKHNTQPFKAFYNSIKQ